MADFESYVQRRELHGKEVERIRRKLEEYLSANEARQMLGTICGFVHEVDEEIDRILKDPMVIHLYDYDGQFFTPRDGWGFHVAFDGTHVLRSLDDSKLELFFSGKPKDFGRRRLLEELDRDLWLVKVRRLNWEEDANLGVLSREVVHEILKDVEERRRAESEQHPSDLQPLLPEERDFFQFYEDQMLESRGS